MSSLRIKLGASVDASVATAFTQLEKAAQRAASAIKKQLGDAGVEATRRLAAEASKGAGPYRQTGEAAVGAATKIRKANTDTLASMGGLANGVKQRFNALHNDLIKLPVDLRTVAQEAQKALAATERARAREALGLGSSISRGSGPGGAGGGGASRNSIYWHPASWLTVRKPNIRTIDIDPLGMAGRFGMGAATFAGRAGLGMARASGIETDWTALAARNVNDEKIAQQISNSGYMPGQAGPNGQIVNRQTLLDESRQTAIHTGMERGEVLEGMQAFVGKTGDLDLARKTMEDMARLSRATGTSFGDMANASAEVANVLGDMPDKGKAVEAIMRQVAGQGKLGAVEVRDMATQMAKIASQATRFQGGAAANIALLGSVAQEAKQRGGATSAASATTSVVRFVEEFTKPSVIKKLEGAGMQAYADAGHTQLKSAPDLIKEILSFTKGDLKQLGTYMPSSIAQRAIGGFGQIYNATQGTDAQKIAAVTAEFERLQSAQLTTEEVTRSFGATMETSEAKAKVFNERMGQVVEKLQGWAGKQLDTLVNGDKPDQHGKTRAGAIREAFTSLFGDQTGGPNSVAGDAAMNTAENMVAIHNKDANLKGWLGSHLIQHAEGSPQEIAENVAQNKKDLQPFLDKLGEDDAHLTMYAADLGKKVTAEGQDLRGNMGRYGLTDSDEDIKKLAGMGGSGGDKATQ